MQKPAGDWAPDRVQARRAVGCEVSSAGGFADSCFPLGHLFTAARALAVRNGAHGDARLIDGTSIDARRATWCVCWGFEPCQRRRRLPIQSASGRTGHRRRGWGARWHVGAQCAASHAARVAGRKASRVVAGHGAQMSAQCVGRWGASESASREHNAGQRAGHRGACRWSSANRGVDTLVCGQRGDVYGQIREARGIGAHGGGGGNNGIGKRARGGAGFPMRSGSSSDHARMHVSRVRAVGGDAVGVAPTGRGKSNPPCDEHMEGYQ